MPFASKAGTSEYSLTDESADSPRTIRNFSLYIDESAQRKWRWQAGSRPRPPRTYNTVRDLDWPPVNDRDSLSEPDAILGQGDRQGSTHY
jgi:hypothetical protein